MRRNGLLQGFTFCDRESALEGLVGRSALVGDDGGLMNRGEVGEVGELGGIGAFLGDSYAVLTYGGVGPSTVRIEAPSSSSSLSPKGDRSEYEFRIEDTLVVLEEVDSRMVSVSDAKELVVELIVDIVRSDAALDAESDVAKPMSCL
tara:strand:- start:3302 stop:3742 length:441 start_codon:yes stop_codon:yes gene_type:complete